MNNLNTGSITGGDLTEATVENFGGTVTGGTFSNVAFDGTSGELTVTGNVDLDEGDALDPLTISQTQIKNVVVAENGTFDAGSASFLGPVTNNGTITGSTFTGPVTNSGEIAGGTFTALVGASATEPGVISGGTFENIVITSLGYVISGGDFKNATVTSGGGIINGGTFSNFTMDSETGELTITGTVNLNANANALAPLTITLDDKSIQSITVEKDATFNAGSTPVSVDVTNDGTISGGMFTGKITGTGTITGGDFFGADISGFTGVLTGGTFAGFTISDTDYGRTLTVTGQDFDLTEINLASFGLKRVVVAAGASVSDADLSGSTGITFQNYGEISGGTFEDMNLENDGAITGGTFYDSLSNSSTITNATIKDLLTNALDSTVTGCQIDGLIFNSGTIEGCTFGDSASVEKNEGTIEVTMTVNGADATFKYGENILSALETTFGEGEWYAVVDGTQTDILDTDTFGLQKQTYACAHYVGTDDEGKKVLYITTPTAVTDDMLAGISTIVVAAGGAITGGELNGDVSIEDGVVVDVEAGGAIRGGTFSSRMDVRN